MLQSVLFIVITVWVSLCLLIYFFQDKLIYFPHKKIEVTPAAISLQHEDITLVTNDSVQLNAWWIPHPDSRATLLFFHGNAGNISHRLNSIDIFHQLGLSVFIIDYRGYGKSTGTPSEQGTYIDAETAWNYLVKEKNIPPENIIIFGRSLGGAVAAALAEKHSSLALIVESSFASITDIGKHYYPYLPTRLLARIKYSTISRMPNIKAPVLIIHSTEDDIIPYKNGKLLYEAAKEPKSFLQINGDHNNGFMLSDEKYIRGINKFLTDILKE
jgi:fermentation-respiration switch protein FrsA (DUF1100 family)